MSLTPARVHAQALTQEQAENLAAGAPLTPGVAAPKASPTTSDLLKMREAFVKKIAKKMEEADLMLQGGNQFKLATLRSGNTLPENELLIFRGSVGSQNLQLKNEMYAVIKNEKLMISFGDFVNATDLAITVSPEKGIATGWFTREDQDFFLDVGKGEYIVLGESVALQSDDTYVEGEDIFVSSSLIEKWFGLEINIDLTDLALSITSSQPLPIEEKALRQQRPLYRASRSPSQLPLQEEPYSLVSTKPYFDVSLNAGLHKNGDAPAEKKSRWTVTGVGDLAGFSSRTFVSGNFYDNTKDKKDYITNIRQTFSREDPDGKLFGPLHVSEVAFGDVSSVPLYIGGGSTTGTGARISNRLFSEVTSLSSVDIQGDALPGWEVELFRDEGSLGLQKVAEDGRYFFPSVFLFAGNNVLRLVFYGPQGEIREETREIFAGANNGLTGGRWDLSAVRQNKQLYGDSAQSLITDGDINLAGSYEYSMGILGTGRAGFSSYTLANNALDDVLRKNILETGYSTVFYDTLLSGDTGFDMDGGYATNASLRRNFGRHLTGLIYSYASAGFASVPEEKTGARQRYQMYLNGPLGEKFFDFTRPRYNLTASYLNIENGVTTMTGSASVSGRLGSLGLSTGLFYSQVEAANGTLTPIEDRISGAISASGKLEKGRWRLSSNYDVQPIRLLAFNGQYTYPFTKKLEGSIELDHRLTDDTSQLDFSANWLADKFTLTPRLSVDNERNVIFTTNMRFGLAPDPYDGNYSMYRNNLSSNGGVASRVFLDANGDGIYNKGEELVDDAEIRALQSNRTAITSKKGIAFIPDLVKSRRTDVVLENNSLPDVYYISLEEGRSVIPRPGVTSQIDFPVVVGGEMDGDVVYSENGVLTRTARNAMTSLNAPTGSVDKSEKTEQDGYYSMSTIRPGFYYVTVQPAPASPPGYALPIPVEFKPGGTTFFGQKIALKEGANVGFIFSSTNQPPGGRKARVVTRADIASQKTIIHVGQYHSRIGLTIGWYKFRLKNPEISDFFNLAKPFDQLEPGPAGTIALPLVPNVPLSMEQGARICENIYHAGFTCTVETVTTYHDKVQSAAAAPEQKPNPPPETPIPLIETVPVDQAG